MMALGSGLSVASEPRARISELAYMNKRQIVVLRALIMVLALIFIFNLYEIGKWKEGGEQSFGVHQAQEREAVLKGSVMAEIVSVGVAGVLVYLLRSKKRS